ncbi:unnamed protein product [Schistocephalus solidus]|uniref:MIF4G domain-containing protein n=1 Tax=Schistocephalus solidus TaxID=70667 RepID=A0A183S8P0_SCHSO|nr:unnamed protein product [Schistocephalus solidus]
MQGNNPDPAACERLRQWRGRAVVRRLIKGDLGEGDITVPPEIATKIATAAIPEKRIERDAAELMTALTAQATNQIAVESIFSCLNSYSSRVSSSSSDSTSGKRSKKSHLRDIDKKIREARKKEESERRAQEQRERERRALEEREREQEAAKQMEARVNEAFEAALVDRADDLRAELERLYQAEIDKKVKHRLEEIEREIQRAQEEKRRVEEEERRKQEELERILEENNRKLMEARKREASADTNYPTSLCCRRSETACVLSCPN